MKKITKAKPRRERSHPQLAKTFSLNFPTAMMASEEKCFVLQSEYVKLRRKYVQLFKRYKREQSRIDKAN